MQALHVRGRVLPADEVRDVFIVDGHFTFVQQANAKTLSDSGYLLPGLVDAHAHLQLASPARNAPPRRAAEASARAHLDAGVLVIREPGSPGRESRGIGPAQGLPRVQTAGHFLAPLNGYFPGLAREIEVSDLPREAAEEARLSGSWAKAIGDFPDETGRLAPNFPLSVLTEAVRAVHALGARFAMHVVGAEAIERAIEAGVDSIEHGTSLAPDHIREMTRRGLAYTPTLDIAPQIVPTFEGMLNDAALDELEAACARQPQRVREAHEAGVRILAGTDAAMVPHGTVRLEMALLLKAGLPADAVLAAGSWDARAYLGYPGIEEGAPADLVVFRDDPHDPAVLARPALIVLDGKVVKQA